MRKIFFSAALGAVISAGGALAQDGPDNVTIGAASVGGTYYVWATGLSSVLSSGMDVNSNVEVTGGPLHNIQLVNSGDMTLGLSTGAPAYEGFQGIEWANGQTYNNIRAILPMYPSYFHWWGPTSAGVQSLEDMNGKIVALGPKGGTPDTYGRRVLDFMNVEPQRIVNVGFSDVVGQLRDGLVDSALNTAGLPHPSVLESESTGDIDIVGVPSDQAADFIEQYPYFSTATIPAETYESLDEDLETVTLWNFVIGNKDLSEEFVYNVVKTVFENRQAMIETHRSSENIKLENLNNITIPLHPGALRYYREQGVEVPAQLIPAEAK